MPYLDYNVTMPAEKLNGRGKNMCLIHEFVDSNAPFAELRLGEREYKDVWSAYNTFNQSIKTLRLTHKVRMSVRSDRLFIIRKDLADRNDFHVIDEYKKER